MKHHAAVWGYVRMNYSGGIMIDDIVNIIYQYYLIRIASNILTEKEQISLLDLLFDKLKTQNRNKNMKPIDISLLFRASENEFDGTKYKEICYGKKSTFAVIQNEFDHVFGGYASIALGADRNSVQSIDPNAFLFVIRPLVKCYGFISGKENDQNAVYSYVNDAGPVFGTGEDIWVGSQCNNKADNGFAIGDTFEIDPNDWCDCKYNSKSFTLKEYEVFSIKIM